MRPEADFSCPEGADPKFFDLGVLDHDEPDFSIEAVRGKAHTL